MNGIMNRCQEEMNRRVDQEGMNGRMDWLGNVSMSKGNICQEEEGTRVKRGIERPKKLIFI